MSFQSLAFFFFLAVTAAVCLILRRKSASSALAALELACLVFYLAGGGWQGLVVLAAGVVVTRAALVRLTDPGAQNRRQVLALACVWHVGVLLVFKYTAFFTGGALDLGWVPLGLSFFTFQQLWLLKEAYTGAYVPAGDERLFLFAFFFPTVTSGPILKPGDFFPQLTGENFLRPGWQDAAAGLYAISCGTAKKVLLADPLGTMVDNGWAQVGDLSAPGAWLVMLGYTLQLYLDFSGYCDIAAGAARLLGIRLPVNFDSPYRSLSVGEFWKRWHMTLTSFLRECVYFPLGGSRRGAVRTYVNILVVFLISGFWHGAGWTFLIWGALHGLAQVAERAWGPGRERLPRIVRWGLTFLFVNLAWVFFRAPDLGQALAMLSAAVSGGMHAPGAWLLEGLASSEMEAVELLLPAAAGTVHGLVAAGVYAAGLLAALLPGNTIRRMDTFRPAAWRCVALAVLLGWSMLSFTGITTFIYSNF